MRSLSKLNLYKSGWVMMHPEEVRVIDSNKKIEEKLMESHPAECEAEKMMFDSLEQMDEEVQQSDAIQMLFEEGIEAEQIQVPYEENPQIREMSMQAEEIIARANAQAEEILQQARILAEQETKQSYERAVAQGMQDGYQQGARKAEQEAEAIRMEYAAKESELKRQYKEMMDELEPHLIDTLTGIYEHVFHVELSQHRGILKRLIANTLRSVQLSDHYLIHVSETDYSYVGMQKAQIIEESCIKNAQLEIVEDKTLAKNECLIETEDGIYDCSLSVQLTELKRKLQLLSYTGKKE